MNWFDNYPEKWKAAIQETSDRTGIPDIIIEKDIIQSLFLQKLKDNNDSIVFKGGTSLSKVFGIINRFSEDIDITTDRKFTASERVNTIKLIKDIGNSLGLKLLNEEDIKSRKLSNKFNFRFDSVIEDPREILVELTFHQISYPVEEEIVSSMILKTYPESSELLPDFSMKVQSPERTLIDKVFATCDYYLKKDANRTSRHIYDIAKLIEIINLNDLEDLIDNVRRDRMISKANPSADPQYNINNLLNTILKDKFYLRDYNEMTKKLLYEDYPYNIAIQNGIEKILNNFPRLFEYRPSPIEVSRIIIQRILQDYEKNYQSLKIEDINEKSLRIKHNNIILEETVRNIKNEIKTGYLTSKEVLQMTHQIVKNSGLGPLCKCLNKLDQQQKVSIEIELKEDNNLKF